MYKTVCAAVGRPSGPVRRRPARDAFLYNAPEGYGSCPVCVCVSVRNLNLGTGASRGLNEGTSE